MPLQNDYPITEINQARTFDKLVDSLRVRVWFNAVKIHSGVSNKALPRLFPSTTRKSTESTTRGESQRPKVDSGYWHKIRRGENMPLKRAHGKQLVQDVDDTFPGTKRWIESPLWDLLSTKSMSTHDIENILGTLHPRISETLLVQPELGSIFKRIPPSNDQYERLDKIARPLFPTDDNDVFGRLMGGVVAVVALIRESEITYQQPLHIQGRIVWKEMVGRLYHFPEIRPLLEELRTIGINRFKGGIYTPDGKSMLNFDN